MFLTFIQDDLVSKNFDVKFSIREEAIQDVSTGLASGLDIQRANSNDTQRGRLCYKAVRRLDNDSELKLANLRLSPCGGAFDHYSDYGY